MNLVVRVKEIKGHCPVYDVNDSFKLSSKLRVSSIIYQGIITLHLGWTI